MKTELVLWKFYILKVFHGGLAFSRCFCVLPIISAVLLEMAKRSLIPTVLNGHKAIGPRNFWDVEQSDWRNGNNLLANPIVLVASLQLDSANFGQRGRFAFTCPTVYRKLQKTLSLIALAFWRSFYSFEAGGQYFLNCWGFAFVPRWFDLSFQPQKVLRPLAAH